MKALVFAVTLAAFSSLAPAGAARDDARPQGTVDTTTRVAMADAGRLGSASLTALSPGSAWKPAPQQTDTGASFEALAPEVDGGTLLVAAGVLALLLARPLSRALRRLEQQRRATALASTLDHSPRG
jgi:hypothetical protein